MSKSYNVALLVDTSMSWGVRIIKGIHKFAQEQEEQWLFYIEPRGRYEALDIPEGWTGDGLIARINRPDLAEQVVASGIPTVNVSWYDYSGPNVARCTVDESETGRIAAQYFLNAGFKNFGYCGPSYRPGYEDQLAKKFRSELQQAGFTCEDYQAGSQPARSIKWSEQLADLADWLAQLPRPAAVLCWSAARGRQITEACSFAGIGVPNDIAVLGGEFDDLMSEISHPPLSTIDQPAERVGYESARLLSRMMRGEPAPEEPTLLAPSRVIVRHSSDTLAIDDNIVRSALRLINASAHEGANVGDIVSQMHIARRALEQRFVRLLGHTPAAEIRRVRIEMAKQLLIDTDLNMSEIARRAGFGEQDLFSRTFRRSTGMTPTQFRTIHLHSD